jgi:hypothetical protein
MHLAILIYQFPLFWVFVIPGVRFLWRRDRSVLVALGGMSLLTAAFASTHGILESYVFYLPVIALIALLIGLGVGTCVRGPVAHWLAAGLVLVALQVGLYRVTPLVVDHFIPGIVPSRNLPGRDASTFFLWPPKGGYIGARQFAESTLDLLPDDSMLIADWTLLTPMRYLQEVEGIRRDVLIVQVDPLGLSAIRENRGQRPLYLANADPRYYPLAEFEKTFRFIPTEHIYELELLEGRP